MEEHFVNKRQKRMLLIAPLFFGYYINIMKEAERAGYQVDYVCDAPSNSNISKAIGRINKNFIKSMTKKYYYTQVYPKIKEQKYDIVILIAGMTFAFFPEMIEQIKQLQKKAHFVMYQWDSETNLPYAEEIHKYFERIYTFDRYDSRKKNIYRFLPLFYTEIYEDIGKSETIGEKYDCAYVGTAHPKKYKDINQMADSLKCVMPRQFIYHYMPSRLKYIYHKITAPEYKGVKYGDFQVDRLSDKDMINVIKQSGCILDAPQSGQRGLTIRTIECIGAKKKLITTNKDIIHYDFYRENNILVFNRNIDFHSPFFTEKYEELPEIIYRKYSLRNWLKVLIGENEKEDI